MFTILLGVALALAALQSPAASKSVGDVLIEELRTCLDKKESVARLDCYDGLARTVAQASPAGTFERAPTPAGTGKWKVDTKINPMDDTKSYVAILSATSNNAGLILRCQSGETEAYIGWIKYLGSGSTPVTIRLGSGAPETKSWTLSSDHRAAFYPGNDRQFMADLAATDKLVAQVTPYGESPITAVFELDGIGDVVAGVRETCKWKE